MLNPTMFLAAADSETVMIVALCGLLIMVPLAAILTHHQRKMAEIIHRNKDGEVLPALMDELRSLRSDVQSMRSELNSNTIAIDGIKSSGLPKSTDTQNLEKRVQS